MQKIKEDVNKWSEFLCDSVEIKKDILKRGIMTKSCSVPSLLIDYELEDGLEDQMII